jgi:hypothetical protein
MVRVIVWLRGWWVWLLAAVLFVIAAVLLVTGRAAWRTTPWREWWSARR